MIPPILRQSIRPRPFARAALALAALGAALTPGVAHALLEPNPVGVYGLGRVGLPSGIAISPAGDVYVASYDNQHVDRFTRFGTWVSSFGSLGAGPGQFQYPCAIAVAPDGSLYVVDAIAERVQHFSATGAWLGTFGSHGSGDGQLFAPRGVAVNAAGEVFVADTHNERVQKFSAAGAYLGQWGGGGADNGRFFEPYGIAVDARGNVWVADTYNQRVQEFTPGGVFVRTWGSQGSGPGQFQFPGSIQVDAGGNVFVADLNDSRVQRFTSAGVFVAQWGGPGAGSGQLQAPQGLAVDARGDVHVADTNNHRLQVFRTRDISGHVSLLAWGSAGSGNGQFSDVRGVAIAPDGSVFVADKNGNRVQRFTDFGAWVGGWGVSGSGDGMFNEPTGVAVDTSGVVYVTDHLNSRVEKFTAAGVYLGKWGSPGAGPGQFTGLWDIAIDAANNVYVVDANRVQKFTTSGVFQAAWSAPNAAGVGVDREGSVYVACTFDHVVRKYAPDGTFLFEWGGFGTNPGQFNTPSDAACDSAGYVYVCDSNGRVQQFTPLGGYVTEWGGSGTALGQLGAPQMMAVDPAGNVYVSEFTNYRVQKFASPPEIVRVADVPGDEGGMATVTFTLSSAEAPASGAGSVLYRIVRFETNPPIGTVLASIPADGVTTSVVVPLATSATDSWQGLRQLQVQALVSVPGAGPLTCTNWGFATDDLPPPAPLPIAGSYSSGATHVHWHASPAGDFRYYQLHRGTSASFPIGLASYIWAGPDTAFDDVGPAGRWYKVVAVDTSGNVSAPAVLGPDQTVAVPSGGILPASAFALGPATPNPFGVATTLRYTAPAPFRGSVGIYDAAGRRVRIWADRKFEATGTLTWDGRTSTGAPAVPGVYFLRVEGADMATTRRIALVR